MKQLINHLKSYLGQSKNNTALETPEGLCPNCWGRQEYAGAFYEAVKTENLDTNNIDQKTGWVQAYAEKHLIGIQLRERDGQLVCNSCNVLYEPIN